MWTDVSILGECYRIPGSHCLSDCSGKYGKQEFTKATGSIPPSSHSTQGDGSRASGTLGNLDVTNEGDKPNLLGHRSVRRDGVVHAPAQMNSAWQTSKKLAALLTRPDSAGRTP